MSGSSIAEAAGMHRCQRDAELLRVESYAVLIDLPPRTANRTEVLEQMLLLRCKISCFGVS